MTGNAEQKTGSDFGFDDALGDAAKDFESWTPNTQTNDKPPVDRAASRQAAEEIGFTSREAKPAPKKEPESQVLIRGPVSLIDDFKSFGASMEPKWPHALILKRAMEALKREMNEQGG